MSLESLERFQLEKEERSRRRSVPFTTQQEKSIIDMDRTYSDSENYEGGDEKVEDRAQETHDLIRALIRINKKYERVVSNLIETNRLLNDQINLLLFIFTFLIVFILILYMYTLILLYNQNYKLENLTDIILKNNLIKN
jgi:hypothetical protein